MIAAVACSIARIREECGLERSGVHEFEEPAGETGPLQIKE